MAVDQTKIIIESLLTGSQFEIAINEHDKVSIVKMNIQKLIGIPSNQLHLLHNQVELNDSTSLKDIPNFQSGIKLKLVLGMKGGPISSSRRVPLTDYDSWFDDVLNQTAKREEPLTIKTTKYLVYKGCKKNVHRLWKMNGGAGSSGGGSGNDNNGKGGKSSTTNSKYGKASSLFGGGSGLGRGDDDKIKKMTDQTIQENIRTTEKINQLRLKMELVNARKKLKSFKFPIKGSNNGKKLSTMTSDDKEIQVENDVVEKPKTTPPVNVKTKESEKIKLRCQGEGRGDFLTAESKMKIKENLSRNRSFKTILTQPSGTSSSSMSLFNNEINPLEFCFTGGASTSEMSSGSKLGRSLSFQSNYIFNRTDASSSLATMEAATISNSTPIIQEYVETICEPSSSSSSATTALKELAPKSSYSSTSMQDLLLQEFLSKSNKTSSSHFQLTPATQLASNNANGLSYSRNFNKYDTRNLPGSALKLTTNETDKIDMFKGTAITKLSSPSTISTSSAVDEYFILPKLLIREEDSPSSVVLDNGLGIVKENKTEELLDIAKQPSAESLIEFYENLTSSSTSSLASGKNEFECFHPNPASASNRFYHSDLDLNQLNDRFKNTLSISNQNMNTSEGNLGGGGGERENESSDCWPRSNLLLLSINQSMKDENTPNSDYNIIEDVNYDKFLNDLLNNSSNDLPPVHLQTPSSSRPTNYENDESDKKDESCGDVTVTSKSKADELIDLFGSTVAKKMPSRRIAPLVKKPIDKLKCFSSNPQLGASTSHYSLKSESSTNLTATATTSSTTVHHIPQLSRLDAIPTKYRRGYINLNDACLSSNSDLSTKKMPKTSSDCHRKLSLKDPITSLSNANSSSFHHGASIFHCRSSSSSDQHPQPPPQHSSNAFDCFGSGNNSMSGRQSRFEYCNSYYSNFNQFASASTSAASAGAAGKTLSKESNLNDFQSEENLFNMNFDSFYEDFVDSSAELSWSSTSSASSTSYDSSSISSMYDKKYVVLPEIKLDNELMRLDKASDEKALMVAAAAVKEKEEDKDPATSGKLRCYQCNKKLGIIMIMKCHCNQYFCSAHRYMEMHNCSYDFKENGRKKLERENPLVCTQKLPKI